MKKTLLSLLFLSSILLVSCGSLRVTSDITHKHVTAPANTPSFFLGVSVSKNVRDDSIAIDVYAGHIGYYLRQNDDYIFNTNNTIGIQDNPFRSHGVQVVFNDQKVVAFVSFIFDFPSIGFIEDNNLGTKELLPYQQFNTTLFSIPNLASGDSGKLSFNLVSYFSYETGSSVPISTPLTSADSDSLLASVTMKVLANRDSYTISQ